MQQQVVFAAPYNFPGPSDPSTARLETWADWREVLMPLLGQLPPAPSPPSIRVPRSQELLFQVLAREPLSPEGRASIFSGSASQLDEGSEDLSVLPSVGLLMGCEEEQTAGPGEGLWRLLARKVLLLKMQQDC